jgi:ABC-type branched-subunit amino acid transport system substrate-binding protein
VKIVAVFVDLSGPGRELGREIQDGARLALRDARRESRQGVELLVQDDQGKVDRAARLAGYLNDLPELVAVIGPGSPATAAAALDVFGRGEGVPTLVPIPVSVDLVRRGDRVFGLAPSAEYLGETLAWFAATELSANSAATLAAREGFGLALERAFASELGRLGGRPAARVAVDQAGGLSDSLARALLSAPAVLVAARPEGTGPLVAALRAKGYGRPILTEGPPGPAGDAPPPDSAAAAAGDSLNAAVYYPVLLDLVADSSARAFGARFHDAYGRPPTEAAALAYDGVNLVLESLENGATDRATVLRWLQSTGGPTTSFQGVSGRFFFSRERSAVRDLSVVSEVTGGTVATRSASAGKVPTGQGNR